MTLPSFDGSPTVNAVFNDDSSDEFLRPEVIYGGATTTVTLDWLQARELSHKLTKLQTY